MRFKIKEIHSWLNQLPENKWRKIYKVDAKRVAYFVNHGSNATLPTTLSRKFGDASFLRELQLAKNFVLHKIDEKKQFDSKNNKPINEAVKMHTISGNKRFMTKTALPLLKKHGIKNVKVNNVAGDFLEIRFLVDINKLKVIDKELTRKNRTAYGGIIETFNNKLLKVIYEEIIKLDHLKIKALYTPGHTSDSFSFLMDNYLFSGDTLLINGTGRTDFQNGNSKDAYNSLFNRLLKLPDETLLYPAHDYKGETVSTIGKEKKFNPRLQVRNVEEYIEIMRNLNLKKPAEIDFNVASNLKLGASI